MKIKKAIERLQDSLDHNTILITRGDKDAVKLGIEAMKFLVDLRGGDIIEACQDLPGETREGK